MPRMAAPSRRSGFPQFFLHDALGQPRHFAAFSAVLGGNHVGSAVRVKAHGVPFMCRIRTSFPLGRRAKTALAGSGWGRFILRLLCLGSFRLLPGPLSRDFKGQREAEERANQDDDGKDAYGVERGVNGN